MLSFATSIMSRKRKHSVLKSQDRKPQHSVTTRTKQRRINIFNFNKTTALDFLRHYIRTPKAVDREHISENIKHKALFAKAAYGDDAARKDVDASWMYHESHSDEYTGVWSNDTTNQVIMANRGTRVDDIGDLTADLHIVAGVPELAGRFKNAESHFESVKEHFKDHSIILTGHSLGGTINNHLKSEYGDDIAGVHNFNPGGTSVYTHGDTDPSVNQYFIKGDVISATESGNPGAINQMFHADPTMNNHTIDQFT